MVASGRVSVSSVGWEHVSMKPAGAGVGGEREWEGERERERGGKEGDSFSTARGNSHCFLGGGVGQSCHAPFSPPVFTLDPCKVQEFLKIASFRQAARRYEYINVGVNHVARQH